MMHGPEKSDPGIVAMKPANKTEQSVAEPVERRAGTKGNADQQSTCRTQSPTVDVAHGTKAKLAAGVASDAFGAKAEVGQCDRK